MVSPAIKKRYEQEIRTEAAQLLEQAGQQLPESEHAQSQPSTPIQSSHSSQILPSTPLQESTYSFGSRSPLLDLEQKSPHRLSVAENYPRSRSPSLLSLPDRGARSNSMQSAGLTSAAASRASSRLGSRTGSVHSGQAGPSAGSPSGQ